MAFEPYLQTDTAIPQPAVAEFFIFCKLESLVRAAGFRYNRDRKTTEENDMGMNLSLIHI